MMKGDLYLIEYTSNGRTLTKIGKNIFENEVYELIEDTIAKIMPGFQIYYLRTLSDKNSPNTTYYDFGSYTHFFCYETKGEKHENLSF